MVADGIRESVEIEPRANVHASFAGPSFGPASNPQNPHFGPFLSLSPVSLFALWTFEFRSKGGFSLAFITVPSPVRFGMTGEEM